MPFFVRLRTGSGGRGRPLLHFHHFVASETKRCTVTRAAPVPLQNSSYGACTGVLRSGYAARWCSLISAPSTFRRSNPLDVEPAMSRETSPHNRTPPTVLGIVYVDRAHTTRRRSYVSAPRQFRMHGGYNSGDVADRGRGPSGSAGVASAHPTGAIGGQPTRVRAERRGQSRRANRCMAMCGCGIDVPAAINSLDGRQGHDERGMYDLHLRLAPRSSAAEVCRASSDNAAPMLRELSSA